MRLEDLKKYEKATYTLRDERGCGLTCSTCMFRVEAEDAYKYDDYTSYCIKYRKETEA